ncbi:MAG: DUF3131 domain-containing protein, partial [Pseudomonadota bacterium]
MKKSDNSDDRMIIMRTASIGLIVAAIVGLVAIQAGKFAFSDNTDTSVLAQSCEGQPSTSFGKPAEVSARDLEIAKIAWVYFQNNSQEKTGLVNSANKYPSTTMWD